MTSDEFRALLASPEGSRVEFKSASRGFHFEDLVKYCVALANEGGGGIVLGVTDRRPRQVTGTRAFEEPGRTEAGLFEQLRQRISIQEYQHHGKRVLLVHVPGRLPGTAWQYKGSFWMRAGDSLVPMTDDQLRRIHEETGPDFSAQVCPKATFRDIDPAATDVFRSLWQRKAPHHNLPGRSTGQLLVDSELIVDGRFTYAALILLGTREALAITWAKPRLCSSTGPTKPRGRQPTAASSGAGSSLCWMNYGISLTFATTCSTSSRGSLFGMCPR